MGLSNTNAFFEQFDKRKARETNFELQRRSQVHSASENQKARTQQMDLFQQGQTQQADQFKAAHDQRAQQFKSDMEYRTAQQAIWKTQMEAQTSIQESNMKMQRVRSKQIDGEMITKGLVNLGTKDDPGAYQNFAGQWVTPVSRKDFSAKQMNDALEMDRRQKQQGINMQHAENVRMNTALGKMGLALGGNNQYAVNAFKSIIGSNVDPSSGAAMFQYGIKQRGALSQVDNQYNQAYAAQAAAVQAYGADSEQAHEASAQVDAMGRIREIVATTTLFNPNSQSSAAGITARAHLRENAVAAKIHALNPSILRNFPLGSEGYVQAMHTSAQEASRRNLLSMDESASLQGHYLRSMHEANPDNSTLGKLKQSEFNPLDLSGFQAPTSPVPTHEYQDMGPTTPEAPFQDPARTRMPPVQDFPPEVTLNQINEQLEAPTSDGLQEIVFGKDLGAQGREELREQLNDGTLERKLKSTSLVTSDAWRKAKAKLSKVINQSEDSVKKERTLNITGAVSGFFGNLEAKAAKANKALKGDAKPLGAGGGANILETGRKAKKTAGEVVDFLTPIIQDTDAAHAGVQDDLARQRMEREAKEAQRIR